MNAEEILLAGNFALIIQGEHCVFNTLVSYPKNDGQNDGQNDSPDDCKNQQQKDNNVVIHRTDLSIRDAEHQMMRNIMKHQGFQNQNERDQHTTKSICE